MFNSKFFIVLMLAIALLAPQAEAAQQPNTEKYNVFAVVSDNIAREVKEASLAAYREEGLDSFPGRGFQTHCTLYMTLYPKEAIDEIDRKVAKIAENVKAFNVTSTGLTITAGDWMFVNLENNRVFRALADVTAKFLAPYRIKSDYVPEWAKNMPRKIEYIKKYGSPNVFDEFNPHLTITAKSDINKLNSFIGNHINDSFSKPINGQIVAIGYGIADKNGQVKNPIKIYKLRK